MSYSTSGSFRSAIFIKVYFLLTLTSLLKELTLSIMLMIELLICGSMLNLSLNKLNVWIWTDTIWKRADSSWNWSVVYSDKRVKEIFILSWSELSSSNRFITYPVRDWSTFVIWDETVTKIIWVKSSTSLMIFLFYSEIAECFTSAYESFKAQY